MPVAWNVVRRRTIEQYRLPTHTAIKQVVKCDQQCLAVECYFFSLESVAYWKGHPFIFVQSHVTDCSSLYGVKLLSAWARCNAQFWCLSSFKYLIDTCLMPLHQFVNQCLRYPLMEARSPLGKLQQMLFLWGKEMNSESLQTDCSSVLKTISKLQIDTLAWGHTRLRDVLKGLSVVCQFKYILNSLLLTM